MVWPWPYLPYRLLRACMCMGVEDTRLVAIDNSVLFCMAALEVRTQASLVCSGGYHTYHA